MRRLWRDRKKRRIVIVAAVALGVVLLSAAFAGAWWLTSPRRVIRDRARSAAIDSADETSSPSVEPTAATAASETPAGAPPDTAADGTQATQPTPAPAGRIAYRQGQTIFVTDPLGGDPIAVASSASGPYALSPDGRSIALVESGTKQLQFIEIDQRKVQRSVGLGEEAVPVWLPDSSGVLVPQSDGAATRIMKVNRFGGPISKIGEGGYAAVAPDAGAIAIGPGLGSADARQVTVVRGGQVTTLTASAPVTAVSVTSDRIVAATFDGTRPRLVWWPRNGAGTASTLAVGSLDAPITRIMRSPSGSHLAFAYSGDDGYSRVAIVPSAGGRVAEAWMRRDNYLLQWSADGAWLYLIEGNMVQGETTSLYRVLPDATGRKLVVTGASL